MRPLLFFLLLLPLSPGLTQSSASPAAPNPPRIENSYDLRQFLVGTTWTWCWKPDGTSGSEITFTVDGRVLHNAFTAKFNVRSRTEVELVWNTKIARLRFDPATYRKYTGNDFDGVRPLYGAFRVPGSTSSLKETTAAAFADPSGATSTIPAGSPGVTFFGTTNRGLTASAATTSGTAASDPAIERDLKTLSDQHAADVATATAPLDKKYQVDVAPRYSANPSEDLPATHQYAAAVATAVVPINKKYQADLEPLLKRAEQTGNAALALKIKSMISVFNANLDGTNWKHTGNAWVRGLRFAHGTMYVQPGGDAPERDTAYQMNGNGFVTFSFDGHKQQIAVAPDRTALRWDGIRFDPP